MLCDKLGRLACGLLMIAGTTYGESGPGTYFNPSDGNRITKLTTCASAERRCTVAFLGGSITEMNGFRPRVMKQLRAHYPMIDFVEIAAGLSSTCSDTGAFRFATDVLAQGIPNVLIVDAAVNDDQDGHFDKRRCVRGLEGIVRQALRANPSCQIVLALMVNESQYKLLEKGVDPIQYVATREVAQHYRLALADVGSALVASAKSGGLDWKGYHDCHPSPEGCDLGAKVVMHALNPLRISATQSVRAIPPRPLDAQCYDQCETFDLHHVEGNWHVSVVDWTKIAGNSRDYFTKGELLWSADTNAIAKIAFKGGALGSLLTAGPDAGDLAVSIDGSAEQIIRLRATYGMLHYPYTVMLADGLPEGLHVVKLRVVAAKRSAGIGTHVRINRLTVSHFNREKP